MMPSGGARPGAGRKRGSKSRLTIEQKRTLTEIAGEFTDEAIGVLASVMRNPKTPAAARVTAANAILDRAHGKPKQPIDHDLRLDQLNDDQLAALALALGAHPAALVGLGGGDEAPVSH